MRARVCACVRMRACVRVSVRAAAARAPAEAAAVIGALVQGGVRFDEAGPEAAGCAGPEVAVLRFPAGSDHIKIGAALVAAREAGP